MSMSDWIRDATERRREEGRQERDEAARRQVEEVWRQLGGSLRAAYIQGYADSQEGKPVRPPGGNGVDGGQG